MFDLYYLLMLIIPLIAQLYVNSNYKKYKAKKNSYNLTGYDVARKILDKNGLNSMYIVETSGELTDHYDPTRKTVKLSTDIYNGTSIASMAVAAHECGHAIQDKEGYFFLKLRSLIYPVVNLGTKFAYIVLIIGLILSLADLIWLAIILVALGLVFQLITLPVELNASKCAKKELEEINLANNVDLNGTSNMLTAAALTYVAGVITSALEVLRLIMMFTNRRD